jgi:hypothetical protein
MTISLDEIRSKAPDGAKKYDPKTGHYYKGKYIFRGGWIRTYFHPSGLISIIKPLN